jgi:ArsR family transcriptional regulator, lead/cadmium/zinc/bismuth-responsive transcriptional repressor
LGRYKYISKCLYMKTSLNYYERGQVAEALKSKKVFSLLAETFQALGDTSRVQIIWTLSKGELCVGDIADLMAMSQPAVSHHLRTLRNLRLVKVRRDGRTTFYSLDDKHIEGLLRKGIEHVEDFLQ